MGLTPPDMTRIEFGKRQKCHIASKCRNAARQVSYSLLIKRAADRIETHLMRARFSAIAVTTRAMPLRGRETPAASQIIPPHSDSPPGQFYWSTPEQEGGGDGNHR